MTMPMLEPFMVKRKPKKMYINQACLSEALKKGSWEETPK